jgi:hypothetical protein
MNPIFFPWVIAASLITADDVINGKTLPVPSRFLASFVAFGLLGGLAETSLRPAAVTLAWGLDIAMFLSFTKTRAGAVSTVGQYLTASSAPTAPAK